MKSKHLGLSITAVPGIENITVEPFEGSEGGVHVLVKLQGAAPMSFGVQELGELITALQAAESHAQFMINHNTCGDDDE